MKKRINKAQLLEFLNGNSSNEDLVAMNQFLKTAVGQDLLEEILNDYWNHAPETEIHEKVLLKWKEEWSLKFDEKGPEVKTKRITLTRIFRYAAVLAAIVLGIGIYSIKQRNVHPAKPSLSFIVQKNPYGYHARLKLSDGTQVYLGPGSALTYPSKFSAHTREVSLSGEAYFEVTKNKHKPFIILTENLKTQVLGTTFKITAFKERPILVSVTSGRVRVDKVKGNKIQNLAILLPGEQLSYSNDFKALKSNFNIQKIQDWKNGRLVFNGTPFHEITEEIGRWYDLDFIIRQPSFNNIPITLTLDTNVPVKELLNTLSVTLGFDYELVGKKVIIK